MLAFQEGGKPEYREKNPLIDSQQSENQRQTRSTHMWTRPQLFEDTVITEKKTSHTTHWILIYPVDSVIHRLSSNLGQA